MEKLCKLIHLIFPVNIEIFKDLLVEDKFYFKDDKNKIMAVEVF